MSHRTPPPDQPQDPRQQQGYDPYGQYGTGGPQHGQPQGHYEGQYQQQGYPQNGYQQGYDQGQYGQQQWPAQQQAWPQQQAWAQPEAPRSSRPGQIALALVVIAGVVLTVCAFLTGQVMADVVAQYGLDALQDPQADDAAVLEVGQRAMGPILGAMLSIAVGLVGWIMGLVALARRQGRGPAIAATILGILAPLVAFFAFAAAMGPAVA